MAGSWEAWTGIFTAIGAFFTALIFGLRNARAAGRQDQRIDDIKEEVTKLVTISTAHTAQIVQHEGTFNTLNVTLQFIQKNIEDSKIAFKEGLADLTKKIEKYFNGSKS